MMQFLLYVIVGFVGQTIDGALGMAYGVSCTSFLLSMGVSAPLASASVHTAEVVTSFVSGISHFKMGNVDRKLFAHLVVPGILGGIIGAFALSNFDNKFLKPIISAYLLVMGIRIIYKSLKESSVKVKEMGRKIYLLGFIGGLMDAIGGGGWGPIVTSTLGARGNSARKSIGSVNAAEFFVTLAQVATFTFLLKLTNWKVILGLMAGGVIAAPLAATITRKINPQKLMLIVGIFISLLSLRTIYLSIF